MIPGGAPVDGPRTQAVPLGLTKPGLAALGEDPPDRLSGPALDLLVDVDECAAGRLGQAAADLRLAAAHEADEKHGTDRATQRSTPNEASFSSLGQIAPVSSTCVSTPIRLSG